MKDSERVKILEDRLELFCQIFHPCTTSIFAFSIDGKKNGIPITLHCKRIPKSKECIAHWMIYKDEDAFPLCDDRGPALQFFSSLALIDFILGYMETKEC